METPKNAPIPQSEQKSDFLLLCLQPANSDKLNKVIPNENREPEIKMISSSSLTSETASKKSIEGQNERLLRPHSAN